MKRTDRGSSFISSSAKIILLIAIITVCIRTGSGTVKDMNPAGQYSHPGGVHDQEQIDLIRTKVINNEQPWAEAYIQLKAEADSRMNEQCRFVHYLRNEDPVKEPEKTCNFLKESRIHAELRALP